LAGLHHQLSSPAPAFSLCNFDFDFDFFYVFFMEVSKLLKWLQSAGGNVFSGHLSHYSNKPVCYYFFFIVNYLVTIFFSQLQEFATLYFFLIANVANQVDIWNWQLMDKRGCTLHKCSGNEC
jgi:hypothetical protein